MSDSEYNFEEKPHISLLRSYKIDRRVINWVEEKISNLSRRVHKFSDETLAAYIFLGYKSLGKDIILDKVLEKTGTQGKKKKILDLISGDSTKNTPIHELGIGIPIIITSPIEYTDKILKKFYISKKLEQNEGMKILSFNIKRFTHIIFFSINILSIYEPKSTACVFVYFYLSSVIKLDKLFRDSNITVRKTHFKTMSLTKGRNSDINPSDFDECLKILEYHYKKFVKHSDSKTIRKLIMYKEKETKK